MPDRSGPLRLEPGATWQGRYLIGEEVSASGGDPIHAAVRIKDNVPVRIRRVRESADSEMRRDVWRKLSERPLTGGPALLESVAEDGGRVEVWQPLEGPTLEERIATAKLMTEDVQEVIRPLAQQLTALHERGLAYLQLAPDRVILPDSSMSDASLTRIEMCVPLDLGSLVAVPTDPTLMPPEAQGLYRMRADEGLMAWDWWALGRLIQELWLGHTVMAHSLGRDLPRTFDAVRKLADKMLKEEDAKAPRAGGVELMKDLPVQVRTLLRGLLTSVRDARWGAREVRQWLDGETPIERYSLARTTVMVKFHDDRLTVAETAQRLLLPEHWEEGVRQWAAEVLPKDCLLDVIDHHRNQLHEQVDWVKKMREMEKGSGLKECDAEVRREILAALTYTGLAGKGTSMRWRGQPLSVDMLSNLLEEPEGMDRLMALLSRSVVSVVQQIDANSAWALDTWSRQIEQATALAMKQDWFDEKPESIAQLARLALKEQEELDQLFTEARIKYRLSTDSEVQALFGSMNPSTAALAVLAMTFQQPEECGYLTHEEWKAMELERLREKGSRLVDALGAMETAGHLKLGLPIFASRGAWWSAAVVLMLLTVVFWPGWTGLGTVAGVIAICGVIRRFLRPVVREITAEEGGDEVEEEAATWHWRDAIPACHKVARKALDGGSLVKPRRLRVMIDRLNEQIDKLAIKPAPEPILPEPTDERLRLPAVCSWLLVGIALSGISFKALSPDWSPTWAGQIWKQEFAFLAEWLGMEQEVEIEIPVVKIDWPHKRAEARGVTILEREAPTPAQLAIVQTFADEIHRLYKPQTLSGKIAVPVPVESGGGLILLDVVSGKTVDGLLYRMAYVPLRGTWMKIGEHDVMFLNSP
jgi:hypothetical protein